MAGQWSDEEDGSFVLGQVGLGGGGEIVLGQTVRAAGGKPVFLQVRFPICSNRV